MQAKICLVSHAHISNNPRVYKEAQTLSEAGYKVSVITVLTNKKQWEIDKGLLSGTEINYDNSINLIPGMVSESKILISKAVRKLAYIFTRYLKLDLAHSVCYSISGLLRMARKINADLYIGHNESGLWVGNKLINEGKKVAFDFEDWYSKDYIVPGRPVKLLSRLEESALKKAEYVTTTSEVMARSIAVEYNIKDKPYVIYNTFPLNAQKYIKQKSVDNNVFSFCWISQTIGRERGLEEIIRIFNRVPFNIELHLIGNSLRDYEQQLSMLIVNESLKLKIHKPINPDQINQQLSKFDFGLAIEKKYPLNHDLTISNKLFHYLIAGLPVIASDTQGQKEAAEMCAGAVEVIDLDSTQESADKISAILNNREYIKIMQQRAIELAGTYNWDNEKAKFLKYVELSLTERNN